MYFTGTHLLSKRLGSDNVDLIFTAARLGLAAAIVFATSYQVIITAATLVSTVVAAAINFIPALQLYKHEGANRVRTVLALGAVWMNALSLAVAAIGNSQSTLIPTALVLALPIVLVLSWFLIGPKGLLWKLRCRCRCRCCCRRSSPVAPINDGTHAGADGTDPAAAAAAEGKTGAATSQDDDEEEEAPVASAEVFAKLIEQTKARNGGDGAKLVMIGE